MGWMNGKYVDENIDMGGNSSLCNAFLFFDEKLCSARFVAYRLG